MPLWIFIYFLTCYNSCKLCRIVINFNVNHTVDTEEEPEINPSADKPDLGEMRSKPQFEVDIVRGNTTLSFTCSFLEGTPEEGEYNDIFGIDEMTIYQGEWNEKVYAVAGDVLDGVSNQQSNVLFKTH